ncbi:serine/threonine protein kinase [Streptomyces scabiei 87.22]|uniref:non-specific serine/threonine protein kinase n=4 Tax=Streptomyces scabiei TaxID=1930 RepID=C9YUX2_STRSW|nr:serine/threonine-protein kinase [Streptomyces scabiei]MDX2578481.1 serine/threonine-protein kinase [Streptomyces scabiei]MDX2655271.1 serine/threonine-protein kinase [Streptomyces scabiei]MDX2866489.1 serine/threonine-protein kinase [Streptomyces scabiei]MDX2882741.1 serine/threonine-protein kinase [Streptomyces scabiei]MDX2897413.1 serine/threonine-protein kinase [Streptomyces scabiei]
MSEAERAGDSRQDKDARLLAGRYRLGGVLGRGGMGTVWRAEDETLGRTVAVKELRFPSSIDADEKRRLITRTLREAKAIARIRNNAAVTVFDVVHEDDRPWIVMELVEGKSLAEAIREDGVLEPKRAAEVGLAILDVLRAAHREGILHRDVKPSNVLIDKHDGRVVLTDFGIAQVEGDPSITSTGMLVGAPSYISPERARGHKPGPAADLWSLGGLLYAAVEGVPPYDKGSAIATLTAVMTEPVPEPKRAGPLRDVIFGLLTKDPERRLDDAGARAMLNTVIHAPDPKDVDPVDATRVVPLPPVPEERPKKRGSGGTGAKESGGERPRAPRWSMRKGAAGAAAAGTGAGVARGVGGGASGGAPGGLSGKAPGGAGTASASPAAVTTRSASVGLASGTGAAKAGGGRGQAPSTSAPGVPGPRAAGAADSAGAGNAGAPKRSSGWPQVPPPDLPPRPVPRAPITDVVPRRTLAAIAVAVVLVVLGTVLVLTWGNDDSSDNSKGADTKAAASRGAASGSDAGSKGADDDKDGSDGSDKEADKGQDKGSDPSPDGETTDEAEGPGGSSPSPTGGADGSVSGDGSGSGTLKTETYKSGQGFSIGLPDGWKYRSTDAAGARFSGPEGQRLLVGWTTTPKSDPVADWKNQERYMVRSQYKRIRIEAVDYRGWNAADWEFTYVESGTKYRSIDRGFVVDSRQGYALMYTAKASKWSGELRKDTWRTFTKTFKPKS